MGVPACVMMTWDRKMMRTPTDGYSYAPATLVPTSHHLHKYCFGYLAYAAAEEGKYSSFHLECPVLR